MQFKKIALLVAILSGLSACSTSTNVTKLPQQSETATTINQTDDSAASLFAKAKSKSGITKIQLLYVARDAAIEEKNWLMLEQISLAMGSKASVDHVQNKLYVAYARKELKQYESALAILHTLEGRLNTPEHQAWYEYLLGSIYASQQLPKKALVEFFKAADIAQQNNLNVAGLDDEIWRALQQLSSYALERFDSGSVLQRGWVTLAKYQQIYLGSSIELDQAMNNWRRRFANHPAAALLPKDLQGAVALEPYDVRKLAVLIPQSGASERLGTALKNGFLAATDSSTIEEVFFIDEMSSEQDILAQLAKANADFVIGPLLKSNVEKLVDNPDFSLYPTLFLNARESVTPRTNEQYFFALNPEHEVEQAMKHFLAKAYKKPMLLAPASASGKRLIEHFVEGWKHYSETAPEIGYYTNSEDMAEVITDLLEVDASKARTNVIKNLFRKEVKSETRSRRDIDVVYILGDAMETRLLKPYLDVNVSTFANKIPLYASSRSYSKQIDVTDKGDLEGLYFTEQPWMLPGAIDRNAIRETYQALWPEQADLEQRLFAMAYDATNLISELRQLAWLSGKSFEGLTGQLSIRDNADIVRSLSWAQYRNKQIRLVSLDEQPPLPLFMQKEEAQSTSLIR
ncbi:penicillin-binding protein activator [Pseudoalteromonas sp. J010]|uniref:penicillin-binding protein activator n=1 Tax=Pseudoalteromonas sp. J010 TaxID=998465 RepID=UPI000F655BA5|nr:penicillin-binding protein activator [Pseudoalteromonas sp. J010]RRS09903.1 penicillin-binding protein activator [Pseudoalteromonas sp. J010]